MKCVIYRRGEVRAATVQAEIKVGYDHLMVTVQAEACAERGEAYYSAETLRYLQLLKEEFARKKNYPGLGGQGVPNLLKCAARVCLNPSG